MNKDLLQADLSAFSDLGVAPPLVSQADNGDLLARFTRNGSAMNLQYAVSGQITLSIGDSQTKYSSYKSLLASEHFGRLREWASVQCSVLEEEEKGAPPPIKVFGHLHSTRSIVDSMGIDLAQKIGDATNDNVKVLLIDGPAGIGKTVFIKQLAHFRAKDFLKNQFPLILHVQSRGRILTFIQDLIAFSLQSLRLNVTFDQVPILARNGLITIAVDGFDELGDPSGYETAWAQLGELIGQIRGQGTLILAGRETFIGRDRLLRDIRALTPADFVDSLTLQLPSPDSARGWLQGRGWTEENLAQIDTLLEPNSFSLRPFFLRRLGDLDVINRLSESETEGTLSFLIDLMIGREAAKFGTAVEAVLDERAREDFVRAFLGEVARDMADNQSEAADEATLMWAVEAALTVEVPDDVKRLLQNRALVVAFLSVDERPRYRRFSHSQLQNYFLALETVAIVRRREIPKFLRRNLLGADFLVTFVEVLEVTARNKKDELIDFMAACDEILCTHISIDRAAKNLSALALAAAPFSELTEGLKLVNQHIDDALVRGTSGQVNLKSCSINQLDVRDSDISSVTFDECTVGGLLINELTLLSNTLSPSYIQIELKDDGVQLITDKGQLEQVLALFGGMQPNSATTIEAQPNFEEHGIFKLLERALRYRGYWIREDQDDLLVAKIVFDPYWGALCKVLEKYELLREQSIQAAGRSSKFYHIRKPDFITEKQKFVSSDLYKDLIELVKSGL